MNSHRPLICGALIVILGLAASGQSGQDRDRDLVNPDLKKEFLLSRPSKAKATNTAPHPFLGITLWRLRPPQNGDQERLLDHEEPSGTPVPLTPERISVDTQLQPYDKVRISVQSARPGYVYVVTQEQYKDGTLGQPILIFPSLRIRDGNHHIMPGHAIEIPESYNRRPYFTLKRSRPDHQAEVISVLVAPQALPAMMVQSRYLALEPKVWEQYKQRWGVKVRRLDNKAAGSWTSAERAAAERNQPLATGDPLPQVLFTASNADGLMASLPLHLAQ